MTDYRYTLTRGWGECDLFDHAYTRGRLCWVMLNPSTADDTDDDPTIRRCIRFSKDHGYGDMEVVNLFAARSTQPKELLTFTDPIGPENDAHICDAIAACTDVVFAWGASVPAYLDDLARATFVWATARNLMRLPLCLGMTKDGSPRHPLYVAANQPFVEWA